MAKAISSEELQLRKRARRRLVGAIALVIVVVVFLPMLLDKEPQPVSENIAINVPAPPGESAARDAAPAEPLRFTPVEPSTGPGQAAPEAPKPRSAPPIETEAQPPEQTRTAAANNVAEPAEGGFVVQLGAFSNAGNAARLAEKVRENRFEAYTEVVSTTAGERTRVRVGPYPTRGEAEQARERLKARKLNYGEPAILRSSD